MLDLAATFPFSRALGLPESIEFDKRLCKKFRHSFIWAPAYRSEEQKQETLRGVSWSLHGVRGQAGGVA